MGNEVVILLVVGIAAAGMAYFSNMLCEPFKLCYSPISAGATPAEYSKGIASILGVDLPKPPEFTGENPRIPVGANQEVMRQLGMTPKLNIPGVTVPIGAGGGAQRPGPKTPAKNKCSQLTGATKAYCEKMLASSFAEAESYYVRTA